MSVVVVSSAGTSGPRGNGWLSGVGVPSNAIGLDGDFYLDTVNVGYYYGPKTAGVWGGARPFGNSLNGVPLTNYSATAAPTVSNDNTQGYSVGSVWVNTLTNVYYLATGVSTGAAVWNQTVPISNTPAVGTTQVATSATASRWSVTPGLYPGTGIIYGCLATFNNATSFNVSAGQAVIVDYTTNPASPTATMVSIAAQTITLNATELARGVNWWVADANGTITSQATRPQHAQRRTAVVITATAQVNNAVVNVTPIPVYTPQLSTQFTDLLYELGPFNSPESSSNAISANGANLSINKTLGTLFTPASGYQTGANDVHYVTSPAETPVAFYRILRNTTVLPTTNTTLDPANYDNNGVLTAVGGGTGSATIQRVFLVPTGVAGNQVYVQYGQTVYSSLSNAIDAIGNTGFVVNPTLEGVAAAIYWVVMTRTCASLLDTTSSAIKRTGRFALP